MNPLWLILTGERHDVTDAEALYHHGVCHRYFRISFLPVELALMHLLKNTKNLHVIIYNSRGFIEPELLLGPIGHLPRLAQMYLDWKGYCNQKIAVKVLGEYFYKLVQNHENSSSLEKQNTFINSYLKQISQTTDTKSSFYGDTGRKSFMHLF